jgi:DNA-binding PadR family transcriptional regulator
MEERGWLSSAWAVSEKGRRAKYYSLTGGGRTALVQEEERWAAYVDAVSRIAPGAVG